MKWLRPVMLATALVLGCSAPAHFQRHLDGTVELGLTAEGAGSVQIAASLNDYRLLPAEKRAGGLWIARLPADRAFKYFYVVDGKPLTPACSMMEPDDFGQFNCIFSPDS